MAPTRSRPITRLHPAAVLAGLAVVVGLTASPAAADGTLIDRTVVSSSTDGVEHWAFPAAWSFRYALVGIRPDPGADYDLSVNDAGGNWLQASARGTGKVDFVTLQTGFAPSLPVGTYQADVAHYSGAGNYLIEYYQEQNGSGPAAGGEYLMDTGAPAGTSRTGTLLIASPQFIAVTGMGLRDGWSYQVTCGSRSSGELFVVPGVAGSPRTARAAATWSPLTSTTATVTVVGVDDGTNGPSLYGQEKVALVVVSLQSVHCTVTNLGPTG